MYIHKFWNRRAKRWGWEAYDGREQVIACGTRTYRRLADLNRALRKVKLIMTLCIRGI